MKRAIFKNMPQDLLSILIIPKSEHDVNHGFISIHEREFKYLGSMYDIVRKYDLVDRIKYICVHDTEEEALITNFLIHSSSDTKDKPIKETIKLFSLDLFNLYSEINITSHYKVEILTNTYYDKTISEYFTPTTPPPKEFFS